MTESTRYTVGIDLGTTNTVLAYVDHGLPNPQPQVLPIPQVVAPGEVQALPSLPSFLYLPLAGECDQGRMSLPWQRKSPKVVVGTYAQARASEAPGRVVFSSKSWLCSDRIDRHAPCLPIDTGDEEGLDRLSPVEAARLILEHLRDAWNHAMAQKAPELALERQTVVITVPASFDAVARNLTVEAAQAAGLTFTLLEEPQAAFYAWLADHENTWRGEVGEGDVVLVCDIGGGTTDFSLIAITNEDGELGLQRLAVGDHTLLGGDNMDLTLAVAMARKLAGEKHITLSQRQLTALTHACRRAKEALGSGATGAQPITILGRGSGLVSGTISTTITEEELRAILLDGFFPLCPIDSELQQARRAGLRTIALDYAADPALTRHLAHFLNRHSFRDGDGNPIPPGVVLFNGGVTKAPLFHQRLTDQLAAWRGDTPATVLRQRDSDLAVARGAAWFAHIRQCGGLRIKAGSARSYYIGIASPMPAVPGFEPPVDALCVVPHGMEEGSECEIHEKGLALVIGEPSDFRFFTSTTRTEDAVGTRLRDLPPDELEELPTLTVELPSDREKGDQPGAFVPVSLRSVLTDIGTLQIWCEEIGGSRRWKLEYELRDSGLTPAAEDSPQ
ncbi:MAG: Hsp70 family protein [Victivallales bacterium]|nr:Hsp70 family protein [Victivallales bacterium]